MVNVDTIILHHSAFLLLQVFSRVWFVCHTDNRFWKKFVRPSHLLQRF